MRILIACSKIVKADRCVLFVNTHLNHTEAGSLQPGESQRPRGAQGSSLQPGLEPEPRGHPPLTPCHWFPRMSRCPAPASTVVCFKTVLRSQEW